MMGQRMEQFFNTAGPMKPEIHYRIPSFERIDRDEMQMLITSGSTFNIKAESLRLGNFTEARVRALCKQHTAATGQAFDEAIFTEAWEDTRERLIQSRATHLDQLTDKLRVPRRRSASGLLQPPPEREPGRQDRATDAGTSGTDHRCLGRMTSTPALP